jgi:hypothetical protein
MTVGIFGTARRGTDDGELIRRVRATALVRAQSDVDEPALRRIDPGFVS